MTRPLLPDIRRLTGPGSSAQDFKILVDLGTIPDFGHGSGIFENIWPWSSWSAFYFLKSIWSQFDSVPDFSNFSDASPVLSRGSLLIIINSRHSIQSQDPILKYPAVTSSW